MSVEVLFVVLGLLVSLYGMIRPESGRMWGSVRTTDASPAAIEEQKRRSREINRILSVFLFLFFLVLLVAIL